MLDAEVFCAMFLCHEPEPRGLRRERFISDKRAYADFKQWEHQYPARMCNQMVQR